MMATSHVRADFVPAADYICPEFAKAEKKKLWPRVWQVACREEEIPRTGDYVTYDICDQSIIVVRSAPDRIQAFYNVCMHRGRRLTEGCGHTARFHCNYHGWRWNLDGSIQRILDEKDWAACSNASHDDFKLPEIKVGTWAGFVFINMDTDAEPLAEFLDPVPDYIDPFQYERARYRWSYSIRIPCNWKVAIEAFDEGYHVAATHSQVLQVNGDDYTFAYAKGKHGMFGYDWVNARAPLGSPSPRLNRPPIADLRKGLIANATLFNNQLHAIRSERDTAATTRLLTEASPDESPAELLAKMVRFQKEAAIAAGAFYPEMTAEQRTAAGTDWHLFPNLVFLPGPTGAIFYRGRPWGDGSDPDWCIFDVWALEHYAPGAEPPLVRHELYGEEDWKGAGAISLILEQDFFNMEQVQKGMKQRGFPGNRTSPIQEVAISNMHRVLHEFVD